MNRLAVGLGLLALVLGFSTPAAAQDDLQAKLDKKLGEAWIKDPAWITDFDEAKQKSAETGKPIFGYFTRSYAY